MPEPGEDWRKKADYIRQHAPDYVGGVEVAGKATDSEILGLAALNDQIAQLSGQIEKLRQQRDRWQAAIKRSGEMNTRRASTAPSE